MNRLLDFVCPQCGQESQYDPWEGPAQCPDCAYSPLDGPVARAVQSAEAHSTHERFLDELADHWNGTHRPQRELPTPTDDFAQVFFASYQQAMGEGSDLPSAMHSRFARSYVPDSAQISSFARAYAMLKRGERSAAERAFRDLTLRAPAFADAWVWLSAAAVDPSEQRNALEKAVLAEPSHPLVRDGWAIFSGRVEPSSGPKSRAEGFEVTLTDCRQCGAPLQHVAGADAVTCPYCGYQLPLTTTDLINERAKLVGDLQLERRYEGHVWEAVQRILRCVSCSAELALTAHLAQRCPYCQSTHVLVEDSQRDFEQPDGLLPFSIGRQEAAEAIVQAMRARLPSRRRAQAPPSGNALQGMFLPFWAYDGFVEMKLLGTSLWAPRDPKERLIDSQTMMFENLLMPAVGTPSKSLLEQLLPYDYGALVPYAPLLIADRTVALHTLDVEHWLEDVCASFVAQAGEKALRWAYEEEQRSGRSENEPPQWLNRRRVYQVSGVSYQLLLLPAWIGQVERDGQKRIALVNAQTAAVTFGRL